jgi:hypothetical protein
VTRFIYNHGFVLKMMRDHCPKEIVRPTATRFGTAYLTLQSMYDLKQPLQSMFTGAAWTRSTYSKTAEGKEARKIVLDDERFWAAVSYAIKTTRPLFKVLRMVDSEKMPAMGFLYVGMEKAKKEIMASLDNEVGAYTEILSIIDAKWEAQMHKPLHAAAACLNPHLHYDPTWRADTKVKGMLYDAIEKLVPTLDERIQVDLGLDDWRGKNGKFGKELAYATAQKRSPGR